MSTSTVSIVLFDCHKEMFEMFLVHVFDAKVVHHQGEDYQAFYHVFSKAIGVGEFEITIFGLVFILGACWPRYQLEEVRTSPG